MATLSPLEAFVRDYVEAAGGAWDEVEPQVYDVLLPAGPAGEDREVLRVAFDPEALPEHPGAQLASYGTPLIDRLLDDAVARGRYARLHGVSMLPELDERTRTRPAKAPSHPPALRSASAWKISVSVFLSNYSWLLLVQLKN